MKNLFTVLSPFAPDQSGAVGVLYELGGLIVICDAGGCAGNICGFDEPRWFETKSAVFSAGLRDMDAILGRDDKLIAKLSAAAEKIKPKFTAIIGTPVPAVIATDYKALKRMAEKATGLPCITAGCTGTNHYDEGEQEALHMLFKEFAVKKYPTVKNRIGVLGAFPLEISKTNSEDIVRKFSDMGKVAICFGMGSRLEDIIESSSCEKNIVICPSAVKTAEYMKDTFGIPYECSYPILPDNVRSEISDTMVKMGKRVLIIHQQFAANEVRKLMKNCEAVDCATWFMQLDEYKADNDFIITDEKQLEDISTKYDMIICDKYFRRALGNFDGKLIDFPHFAASGRLE